MTDDPQTVAALLLAAGRSTRMGDANKLLQSVGGVAMVRLVAETLNASSAAPLIVVTGHQAGAVARVLEDLPAILVHNARFAEGLSTSLQAGLAALPPSSRAVLVALADMPWVKPATVDALAAAFAPHRGAEIAIPTHQGQRGNPVLIGRRFFSELGGLTGDHGARPMIARHGDAVIEVPVDDPGILRDIDRPEDLPGPASPTDKGRV